MMPKQSTDQRSISRTRISATFGGCMYWKIIFVFCACYLLGAFSLGNALGELKSEMRSNSSFTKIRAERTGELRSLRNAQKSERNQVTIGIWGGEHISMTVTSKGGTVEYDCAHGTISRRIVLDRRGRLNVQGTHVEEHGGPVREGEQANSFPVLFTGRIKGKRMYLTVKRRDNGQPIGIFTLVYGQEPSLFKCK